MKISDGKAVVLDYKLSEDGKLLESTHGNAAFSYLHGNQQVVPGLEKALNDREAGDNFEVTIPPAEAYGEVLEGMTQVVDISMFEGNEVEEGAQFHAQTNQGPQVVTVTKVADGQVTIDGNHPMAGKTLTFEVDVKEVRDATEDEVAHGHVHGEGCNHDH